MSSDEPDRESRDVDDLSRETIDALVVAACIKKYGSVVGQDINTLLKSGSHNRRFNEAEISFKEAFRNWKIEKKKGRFLKRYREEIFDLFFIANKDLFEGKDMLDVRPGYNINPELVKIVSRYSGTDNSYGFYPCSGDEYVLEELYKRCTGSTYKHLIPKTDDERLNKAVYAVETRTELHEYVSLDKEGKMTLMHARVQELDPKKVQYDLILNQFYVVEEESFERIKALLAPGGVYVELRLANSLLNEDIIQPRDTMDVVDQRWVHVNAPWLFKAQRHVFVATAYKNS